MDKQADKIKAAIARGKQRFFEQHPNLLRQIDAISDVEANQGGTSGLDMREVAKYRAFASAAKAANKKDSLMLLLELGADSKEELEELLAAQNNLIKKSIGM